MGISVVMGSPTSLKIVYWPTPFLTRPQGLGFAVVRVSLNGCDKLAVSKGEKWPAQHLFMNKLAPTVVISE